MSVSFVQCVCCHHLLPPHCYRSNTFSDSNTRVTIEYSQGGFNGYIGSDVLKFKTFDVTGVSVAIIEKSWNFFGSDPQWQGILGLAYDSLMKVTMAILRLAYDSLMKVTMAILGLA